MRNDVKTLIAALTTERNAIDRAIAGLKCITTGEDAAPAPAPKVIQRRRRVAHRTAWPVELKRTIVALMQDADERHEVLNDAAKRLAREFGVPRSTIASNWRAWRLVTAAAQVPSNGTAELTTELAGSLQ